MNGFVSNRFVIFKALFALFVLLQTNQFVNAQSNYAEFGQNSLANQNTGMYVLGGWAIANMASGAYGWANLSGDKMYFHQMNLMWNVFNLSIAGIGLYNNSQIDFETLSSDKILTNHIKVERILLINSALDLGYIGTGFLLRYLSNGTTKNPEILRGYGNSLILQGGFLLVFDLVFYQVLRSQRLDFIENINFSANSDFLGMQILINI